MGPGAAAVRADTKRFRAIRLCLTLALVLTDLIHSLAQGRHLSDAEVCAAVRALTADSVPVESKADFLAALAAKGETVEEIGAFARELRNLSVPVPLDDETRQGPILDVCGTGGDRLSTFNISTTVAFIAAAAGVTIAKHGNRAVTSLLGSADVLEALGVPVTLSPEAAARSLREHRFAFLFAPHYHPAFKHIVPARKLCGARGQRTIFNFLGPLLNPVRPSAQLIGVPRPELCEPMARVLQSLGIRRGMVVSGAVPADGQGPAYLDEMSILGETAVAEFYQERGFALSQFSPSLLPIRPAVLADLAGGDKAVNVAIIRGVLDGSDRGPRREVVLLNAGAALFVAGKSRSIADGWELAAETIDRGAAVAKLRQLAAQT